MSTLSASTVQKVVHAAATKMSVSDDDAFTIICASSVDRQLHDPDIVRKNLERGRTAPDWFIDTAVDIITGRIPLVDYHVLPLQAKRRR